jgi:hypothetical protein
MATEPTTSPRDAKEPARPTPPAVPAAERPTRRRLRWLPRYTWSGTTVALLAGLSSLTPLLWAGHRWRAEVHRLMGICDRDRLAMSQ